VAVLDVLVWLAGCQTYIVLVREAINACKALMPGIAISDLRRALLLARSAHDLSGPGVKQGFETAGG
jgi:hypothetical protein